LIEPDLVFITQEILFMIEDKILIVDEDQSTREMTEKYLFNHGYQVKTAKSPMDALRVLDNERFPIVLTALKMNGLNGLEMCKQIKRRNLNCVVYALSSYLKEYDPEQLESFGFDGYIKKPIRTEILDAAIKGAMDKLRRFTFCKNSGHRPESTP